MPDPTCTVCGAELLFPELGDRCAWHLPCPTCDGYQVFGYGMCRACLADWKLEQARERTRQRREPCERIGSDGHNTPANPCPKCQGTGYCTEPEGAWELVQQRADREERRDEADEEYLRRHGAR